MERSQMMDGKINILMKEIGRLRGVIQKDRGLPADADSDAEAEADAEEGVAQEQAPLEQVPRKTTTTDWGLWQSNWAVKNPDVPRDENFATKMSEAWKQWKEAHPGQTYRGFRGSDELIPRQTQAKTRRKVKTAQPPPLRRTPPPSRKQTPFAPAPAPAPEAFLTPQRDPDEVPRALAPPEEEYEYPPTPPPSLKSKSKIPGLAPLSLEKPALPSREVMNSSLLKRATPAILGSPEEEYGELPVGEYHTPFAQAEEEEKQPEEQLATEEEAPLEEEEQEAAEVEEEAPASAEDEEAPAEDEEAPAEEEEAPAEEEEAPAEEEESANTTPSASLNSRANNGANAKNNSKKSANTAPSASLNSRVKNGASKNNSKKSRNSGSPTPLGWDDQENFGEINSQNKTPKSP